MIVSEKKEKISAGEFLDMSLFTVDKNGNYRIIGKIGDTAKVIIQIKNNIKSAIEIPVKVVSVETHNYSVVVEPMFNDIKQGRTKVFNVNLYDNGELITNDFDATANWVNEKYYKLKKLDDGSFELKNVLMNNEPLVLHFVY